MGFRLQRRIKIAPGVNLNVSKSGLGVSVGPKGARASIGTSGARTSVGIPGTGMRYEKRYSTGSGPAKKPAGAKPAPPGGVQAPRAAASGVMQIGALSKAFKRPDEKAFISACQNLIKGDEAACLSNLKEALAANPECFDAHIIAGMLRCKSGEENAARAHLEKIVLSKDVTYPYIDRYMGPGAIEVVVPIAANVKGRLGADTRAAYMLLAEVYQEQGFREHAVEILRRAMSRGYTDDLVKLSMVELLNDMERDEEIIQMAQGTENKDNVSVAIIFYLGQAMARKGYLEAAREILKKAVSKKKDRDPELINEARYVLANNYEREGKKAMAVKQYQTILAQDYNFRDVRAKLDALSPKPSV